MKAYRLLAWEQTPQLVEVEVPRPGPGQALIKVGGNGLCHSDLGMLHISRELGESLGWRTPFTLGHEVGGWVEETGPGVSGLATGDAVAVISFSSDGTCPYCVRGMHNACANGGVGRGYGRDGGLAQYVVADAREIIKLKTLDPVSAGTLTDAGATSYHAVKRVLPKLIPGSTAVVIGAGGLGSFAVQFLRVMSPARVIAVDINEDRLRFAAELGAHEGLIGVDDNTAAELRRLTAGEGAAAVLDFVGIDATIGAGVAAVRKAGAYALVGAGMGASTQPWMRFLPADGEVFTFQGSTIADTQEVIALAEAGLIRNEVELFPFNRVAEAYEKLHNGQLRGRAVVMPNIFD